MTGNKSGVCNNPGACEGGMMLYAVIMIALLSLVSVTYLSLGRSGLSMELREIRYKQVRISADSIHRSFCEAIDQGSSEAMNEIWDCFLKDCEDLRVEYEEEMAGKIAAQTDGQTAAQENIQADEQEDMGRWEEYLRERMESKTYEAIGEGDAAETGVRIQLTACPMKGTAAVRTEVTAGPYRIVRMAELRFDNREGPVLSLPSPDWAEEVTIPITGNGVYRYYGEDTP